MYARVTLFEIDMLRISRDDGLQRFTESVLPELRRLQGYEGVYVLGTPEGKGLVLSLWATKEAALAGVESGHHDAQLSKFVSVFRSPPGREHYEVLFAETLGTTKA
ncbi:MAG: hypothetical protein HY683_09685 [Chloroflexi bacterium]|nr:hypothetical protein [Chloroflexota bacterium]